MIGPVLRHRGIEQKHIRGNGELHLESELLQDEKEIAGKFEQLTLFSQPQPEEPWRSHRPAKGKQST